MIKALIICILSLAGLIAFYYAYIKPYQDAKNQRKKPAKRLDEVDQIDLNEYKMITRNRRSMNDR